MTSADVRDILSLDDSLSQKAASILDKDALLLQEKKKIRKTDSSMKRPDHVHREVWGLKSTLTDFLETLPCIASTETTKSEYKQKRMSTIDRVRKWLYVPFENQARTDGLLLKHWQREDKMSKEEPYYFARFNKTLQLPEYTDEEYENYLVVTNWSRVETDYLMSLAKQFDLNFIVMKDRWDAEEYPPKRDVIELKKRYYMILDILLQIRKDKPVASGEGESLLHPSEWDVKPINGRYVYDAEHERKRKEQLEKFYNQTPEAIAEEQKLVEALRRIEERKREREQKAEDLERIISQAENLVAKNSVLMQGPSHSNPLTVRLSSDTFFSSASNALRKRLGTTSSVASSTSLSALVAGNQGETLKFQDFSKSPGVHLRSAEMRLPQQLGQKKVKTIESFLSHFGIDSKLMAFEEITEAFNSLRADIVLLQELYSGLALIDYELQLCVVKHSQLAPGQPLPTFLEDSLNVNQQGHADPQIMAAMQVCVTKNALQGTSSVYRQSVPTRSNALSNASGATLKEPNASLNCASELNKKNDQSAVAGSHPSFRHASQYKKNLAAASVLRIRRKARKSAR